MVLRKYGVIAVLCLSTSFGFAQKTAAYLDKESLLKDGLELFDKKQFVAAQKSFSDYLSLKSSPSLLKTDAEYYAPACAGFLP